MDNGRFDVFMDCMAVLINGVIGRDEEINEFFEEHKIGYYFIQLYAKKPAANMTYETLLKYEKYYSDNFLYQCLCYDYADLAEKEHHFSWIVENKSNLPAEELFYYLEILSKESRYDLLLEMNQKPIASDARLFIANQLAASLDTSNLLEARKIYEGYTTFKTEDL